MDWQTVRTWAMANLRLIFFITGTIFLLIFLIFGGDSPDSDILGGGFWTLIASGLLFWGSHKTSGTGSKVLGIIAIMLLIIWAWPRIFPFLNTWGFAPNLFLTLAILVFIWIWKKGNGFLFWRLGLFIILIVCWLGNRGAEFKDSINAFLTSAGIEFKMPDLKTPKTIENIFGGLSGYAENLSAQKASELKERMVKNGSTFYNHDGTKFTKKEVSASEEFIKVFLLGESIHKDGLTFEKVRIGDPATGEEAWVYSGILLSSPTAKPATAKSTISGKAPEWEIAKDCPINFSGRTFSNTVGPDGERAYTGEVYTECFLETGYDYKITFSGEYTKRLITQEHRVSWRGFSPQSQGIVKPFPQYEVGALTLRIGSKDGLHPEAKKDFIVFTPTEAVKIFAEVNVNREEAEYRNPKVGSKLKNSTLSIKLERRPI